MDERIPFHVNDLSLAWEGRCAENRACRAVTYDKYCICRQVEKDYVVFRNVNKQYRRRINKVSDLSAIEGEYSVTLPS
jgi:hypothetical protein